MRCTLLYLVLLLTTACGDQHETFRPEITNADFVELTVDGQTERYAGFRFAAYLPSHSDGATESGGGGALEADMYNTAMSSLLQLNARGDLHRADFPVSDLPASMVIAGLLEDSTPGCPHFDYTNLDSIAVTLTLASWDEDQLIGSLRAADGERAISGEFSLLVARPTH